jgi:hypothetical protein
MKMTQQEEEQDGVLGWYVCWCGKEYNNARYQMLLLLLLLLLLFVLLLLLLY